MYVKMFYQIYCIDIRDLKFLKSHEYLLIRNEPTWNESNFGYKYQCVIPYLGKKQRCNKYKCLIVAAGRKIETHKQYASNMCKYRQKIKSTKTNMLTITTQHYYTYVDSEFVKFL